MIEDRMESKMKKFEKITKNGAITSSGYVTSDALVIALRCAATVTDTTVS